MNKTLLWLLLLLAAGFARPSAAQVQRIHIGVNGLTCSQCTRNVEMSLRRLPFIQDVAMNLEHTDGIINLKQPDKFDLHAIARAVRNAGFSLRFLKASMTTFPAAVTCFRMAGAYFQIIPRPAGQLSVEQPVQFIGEDFLPPAELKKWKAHMKPECAAKGDRLYFITPTDTE